jgi:DNA-directed RNA polymerase subunit M/transcription elongation factor TFIIS
MIIKIDLKNLLYNKYKMNFCEKCDNMYYMKINDQDDLKYYCRNCGFEDDNLTVTNLKISVYEKKSNTQKSINTFIKYDPTLPHSHTIKCPNEKCESNLKDKTPDIIYYRYDDTQMKYMYICADCDFNWKP